MRKNVFGRRLRRDKNERTALFKNLMSSLILHERMQTTQQKANAIRASIDKLITKAKQYDKHNMVRFAGGSLHPAAIEKLVSDIAPRFMTRNGGYTRIVKLGKRVTDSANLVIMELTELGKKVSTSNVAAAKEKEEKKIAKKETKVAKKEKKVTPKKVIKAITKKKS